MESVLLYGCEAWTLDDKLEKGIDGCYTGLLRAVQGFSWKDKIPNTVLYGNLPKISDKIRSRRLRLAGHIQRHTEEAAHHLLLWNPVEGKRKNGRPMKTFIKQLAEDTAWFGGSRDAGGDGRQRRLEDRGGSRRRHE